MQSCLIVDCDLFAWLNIAQRNKKNVIVEDLHKRIRIAGVVDVMSAISASAAVKAEAAVNFANSQSLSMRTPSSLCVADLFSSILGDFSASAEILRGETSFTMDPGTLDC